MIAKPIIIASAVVQFLVDQGAAVNQATADGHRYGGRAQVRPSSLRSYLQKAGANLEATDKEGRTPLMIAKQRRSLSGGPVFGRGTGQ